VFDVLFLLLLGLSRCRAGVRLGVEILCMFDSYNNGRIDVATFIGGMIIAELRAYYDDSTENDQIKLPGRRCYPSWAWDYARAFGLIAGLYVACFPREGGNATPGYKWLAKLWPGKDQWLFWQSVGSFLTILALTFLPDLQKPFTARVTRYAGRISYSIYLNQWILMKFFRDPVARRLSTALEQRDKNPLAFDAPWMLSLMVYLVLLIWYADVFTRAVDEPSVNLARWIEDKCAVKKPV